MSGCQASELLLTISPVKSTGSGPSTETLWNSGMCDITRSADHRVGCLNLVQHNFGLGEQIFIPSRIYGLVNQCRQWHCIEWHHFIKCCECGSSEEAEFFVFSESACIFGGRRWDIKPILQVNYC